MTSVDPRVIIEKQSQQIGMLQTEILIRDARIEEMQEELANLKQQNNGEVHEYEDSAQG